MEDPQHHESLSIETILKYVSGAENLENDLPIFLSPGNGPAEPRMAGSTTASEVATRIFVPSPRWGEGCTALATISVG